MVILLVHRFLVWLVSLLVPVLPVGLCHVTTLTSHNVYNCLHLLMTLHAVALRHGVTSGLWCLFAGIVGIFRVFLQGSLFQFIQSAIGRNMMVNCSFYHPADFSQTVMNPIHSPWLYRKLSKHPSKSSSYRWFLDFIPKFLRKKQLSPNQVSYTPMFPMGFPWFSRFPHVFTPCLPCLPFGVPVTRPRLSLEVKAPRRMATFRRGISLQNHWRHLRRRGAT